MNRYKKRVALDPEAARYIVDADLTLAVSERRQNVPITPRLPVDFNSLFGNARPVEIEVGFGTGTFLAETSKLHPEKNFLGIEITKKMVFLTANRLLKENTPNARLVLADASLFFKAKVPDGSVERIHVYFPDPWVKKRHHKRRIMNRAFLKEAFRALVPGGRINFFTDHRDYFNYFLEEKAAFGLFKDDDAIGACVPTAYERKWTGQGREIYRAGLEKP
jgi:tRNA (guanine-N7-)-methyltransferase